MNIEVSEQNPQIRERSFDFAVRIVNLCKALENQTSVSRTLANQLLRSGTSIGANIEEANGSQSKADFTAKMYIACKEARETNYWLRILASAEIIPKSKLEDILDESHQIVSILTAITKTSRKNRV